jgi:hypothetical protein
MENTTLNYTKLYGMYLTSVIEGLNGHTIKVPSEETIAFMWSVAFGFANGINMRTHQMGEDGSGIELFSDFKGYLDDAMRTE